MTSLFTRIGRIGKIAYLVNTHQVTLPAALESLYTQYDGASPPGMRDYVAGAISQTQGYIANQGSWLPTLQALAQNTLLRMVQLDTPSAAGSLKNALVELIRQMKLGGNTVQLSTVSATSAALTGMVGTGQLVVSTLQPDGSSNELLIPEVGRLVCVSDSYLTGSVAGNEAFQYRGQIPTSPDVWAYDWPSGTGADSQQSAISPTAGTLLVNGNFLGFAVANVPDNWIIATGSAQVFQDSATFYASSSSVKFVGDGATLTALTQVVSPSASTLYAPGLWFRLSAVPAAGVLALELVDSTGAVILDDAGAANTVSIALPAQASATWIPLSGVFRVPKAIPLGAYVRLRLSTALSVGVNLWIDQVTMGAMNQVYAGGPYLALLAGATPFALNDQWSVTGSNNRGGATYNATFNALFDRIFGMRFYGLILPSNAVPTIPDSLITS